MSRMATKVATRCVLIVPVSCLFQLLLACLLCLALLVHGSSAQPKLRTKTTDAAKPTRPVTVASAGLRIADFSLSPLPFPTPCLSESFGCCNRSLVLANHSQDHLDYLDSLVLDGVFNGPKACSIKVEVFVLSTGIDAANDGFREVTVVVEPDCKDTSVSPDWTPNIDVFAGEGGTILAGGIVAPYGTTPNVIVHSVKVAQDYGSETTASMLCGIGRVVSWLRDNPCRKAIVDLNMSNFQYQTAGVEPVNDAVTALVREFGHRVVVVTEFLRAFNQSIPAAILPEVLAVGSVFINPDGTLQIWDGSRTLSADVFVVADNVLSPKPNAPPGIANAWSCDLGILTGVLAQYWVEHPQLTGDQLRCLIQNNAESDIHVSVLTFDVPPGIPPKLLRYNCKGGCEPCLNGGTLVNATAGALTCDCPPETTGDRCGTFLCSGQCAFGHPAYCERFVSCGGDSPIVVQCRKQDGIQLYFDPASCTCKLPCEAKPRPGCRTRCC